MLQFTLLKLIGVDFGSIDWSGGDIAKIEKRLKLEARINPAIGLSAVDNLIVFLKTDARQLASLLEGDLIFDLANENPPADKIKKMKFVVTNEQKALFLKYFEEHTVIFLNELLKKGRWKDLMFLQANYSFIFNINVKAGFYRNIEAKLESFIQTLQHKLDVAGLGIWQKHFSIDKNFYKMLSEFDSQRFSPYVFRIVSKVIAINNENDQYKKFFGFIFLAMKSFKSIDQSDNTVLQNNWRVAHTWVGLPVAESKIDRLLQSFLHLNFTKNAICFFVLLGIGAIFTHLFFYSKLYFLALMAGEIIMLALQKRIFANEQKRGVFDSTGLMADIRRLTFKFYVLQVPLILIALCIAKPQFLLLLAVGAGVVGLVYLFQKIKKV